MRRLSLIAAVLRSPFHRSLAYVLLDQKILAANHLLFFFCCSSLRNTKIAFPNSTTPSHRLTMPPPSKRRKINSATKYSKPITRPSTKSTATTTLDSKTPNSQTNQEPTYDPEARADYLSGFRKRKQQRIKHAREEAKKKERELKIESRKQVGLLLTSWSSWGQRGAHVVLYRRY